MLGTWFVCFFFFPYIKLSKFLERVHICPHKIKFKMKWLSPGLFKGEIAACSHICRMMVLIPTSPGRPRDSLRFEKCLEPWGQVCAAGEDGRCWGGGGRWQHFALLLCPAPGPGRGGLWGPQPPASLALWLLVGSSQQEAPEVTRQSREKQSLLLWVEL